MARTLMPDLPLDPAALAAFVHGTTVGINTVIQRKGAALALLTTAGFEDVIELARLRMPDMHGLFCERPDPLVPRDRIFGLAGRVLSDGSVQSGLDPAQVRDAAHRAQQAGAPAGAARRAGGVSTWFIPAANR